MNLWYQMTIIIVSTDSLTHAVKNPIEVTVSPSTNSYWASLRDFVGQATELNEQGLKSLTKVARGRTQRGPLG